jgi:predicted RNase H-like HicB family nuclease
MNMTLTAIYIQVPEGFIGFVEELPGANTQGGTLDETRDNLREAVEMVLEANRELAEESLRGQTIIRESLSLSAA